MDNSLLTSQSTSFQTSRLMKIIYQYPAIIFFTDKMKSHQADQKPQYFSCL